MQLPPSEQLLQIATGHVVPRCLHVVAELALADQLAGKPVPELDGLRPDRTVSESVTIE